MQRIITTYVFVVFMLSLGFFGVGALASAEQFGAASSEAGSPPAEAVQESFRGR
jgi:hypothetical protein